MLRTGWTASDRMTAIRNNTFTSVRLESMLDEVGRMYSTTCCSLSLSPLARSRPYSSSCRDRPRMSTRVRSCNMKSSTNPTAAVALEKRVLHRTTLPQHCQVGAHPLRNGSGVRSKSCKSESKFIVLLFEPGFRQDARRLAVIAAGLDNLF